MATSKSQTGQDLMTRLHASFTQMLCTLCANAFLMQVRRPETQLALPCLPGASIRVYMPGDKAGFSHWDEFWRTRCSGALLSKASL